MTRSNIVATNVLPLEEFGFSRYVYGVDPNSICEIKTAILSAYDAPINEEFSAFVKDSYSLKTVFQKHYNIYKSL